MNRTLERLVEERDQANRTIDEILGVVEEETRDPSDAERELLSRHRERLGELEGQISPLLDIEEQRAAARDARAVLVRAGNTPSPSGNPPAPANPEVVYRTFAQWARDEMIARFDAIATRAGVPREVASERLTRAVAHTLTADVPGLLPPQHLAEIVQVISAARPVVQSSRQVPLTNGKLTYPKITQRPTVGKQAAEKTEAVSQKMTVGMEDVLADTYAGAGNLSWQTINWTVPDALQLWFSLMAEAYAQQTETAACGVVTAAAAANVTTAAGGSPSEIYAALAEAAGAVYARVRMPATTLYADIATAFRLGGTLTTGGPLFQGSAGTISFATGQGNVGGLALVASPGFPADTAIVGVAQMLLCAETPGAPVELRAVEPSIGGMEVGVIGAFAAEALEPLAFQDVTLPAPPPLTQSAPAPRASAGK